MRLGYFPGCSLHGTAREFDESVRAIAGPLGLDLVEIADWSCCGATSAHATNHLLAVALAARNLALAECQGHGAVMAPCAACFNRLADARHEIGKDEKLAGRVSGILDRPFANAVAVKNLVEVLQQLGPAIRARASRPLAGLKVACYYGCLLVRPGEVCNFDDPEAPTAMEDVVTSAGATPVRWNLRLECCGGGFSIPRTGSVIRLGRAILADARAAGAEAIAVACPMCHSNLDFRQGAMARRGDAPMPILFLSELVGLALGIEPRRLGMERHYVSTAPLAAYTRDPAAKAEVR